MSAYESIPDASQSAPAAAPAPSAHPEAREPAATAVRHAPLPPPSSASSLLFDPPFLATVAGTLVAWGGFFIAAIAYASWGHTFDFVSYAGVVAGPVLVLVSFLPSQQGDGLVHAATLISFTCAVWAFFLGIVCAKHSRSSDSTSLGFAAAGLFATSFGQFAVFAGALLRGRALNA
eukprot:m51a1_g698 hypothetical protein (176) ;mRNA; r:368688-369383